MNRQLIYCLLLIGLSFPAVTNAQTIHRKQLDSLLVTLAKPTGPGLSVAIWQHGKLKYDRSAGLADIAALRKNTPFTPFNIASTSKQFTAAAIYILADRGKLSTDDKLSKYFPDFPAYADSITIAHLIHHQSGLRDLNALIWLRDMDENSAYTDSIVYNVLVKQHSLNFSPGTQFSYSNSGYFLLSLIVKKVSGQDLAEFTYRNIFKPLKMDQTAFSRTHQVKNKANGYVVSGDTFVVSNLRNAIIGSSNIYSMIYDFGPWFREMANHKLLGEAVWKKMLTPAATTSGEVTRYAGGLSISNYRGDDMVSHGGDLSGYHSGMFHLPKRGVDIIVMGNHDQIYGSAVFRAIYELWFPTPKPLAGAVTVQPVIVDTAAFTGIYTAVKDSILSVGFSISDGKIMLKQYWNNEEYAVVAISDSTLAVEADKAIQFVFGQLVNNKAGEMTLLQDGNRTVFKRTDRAVTTDHKTTEEYIGRYYSPEIEAYYELLLEEGALKVLIGEGKYGMVNTGAKDSFIVPANGLEVKFTRNDQAKVTGFTLIHVRVNGLTFKKQ